MIQKFFDALKYLMQAAAVLPNISYYLKN